MPEHALELMRARARRSRKMARRTEGHGRGQGVGGHSTGGPAGGKGRAEMHWTPPPASRAPSLCPATVPLAASAGFNGICNRQ